MRGTFLRENLKISSNYQYVTCRVNDFLGHVFLIPPIQYIIIRIAFITPPRPAANRLAGGLGVVIKAILILNRGYAMLFFQRFWADLNR